MGAFLVGRFSAKKMPSAERKEPAKKPFSPPKPPSNYPPNNNPPNGSLPNNPSDSPNEPNNGKPNYHSPNPTQLNFTVLYYTKLKENHMYIDADIDSDKIILIDQKNLVFRVDSNLNQKGSYYTISFFPQNAEKYENKNHIYYFSKNNSRFILEPKPQSPSTKKEIKVRLSGESLNEEGREVFYAFTSLPKQKEVIKLFYVSKEHPRIKELLKKGKLVRNKHFIIRYGKVDKNTLNFAYDFNEFNQELEIIEV